MRALLGAFLVLAHLILITHQDRLYYNPHITDTETEAEKLSDI